METHDLSDFIKMLMDKKNLTLEKVAEKLFITKQGFHKWVHKRQNVNWKIESLLTLSELLEFDLVISRGKLYVKESELMNLEKGKKDVKKFDVNLEAHVPLSVENSKVNYEVCKKFKDYSIVKLYASNNGVNDDIEPTLMEGWLDCYNTKEECLNDKHTSSAIEVYALMNNETGELEDYEPSLYIENVETTYYIGFAPTIETTEEGYEVVAIDEELDIKIARAYAEGNVINNEFYVTKILPKETKQSLIGIAVMNTDEKSFNNNSVWYSDIRYAYEELIPNYLHRRYFDKDRNEIKAGDILIYEGFNSYMEGSDDFYDCYDEYGSKDDFKEADTIEVKRISNNLAVMINELYYDLNSLQLLKWKKL